MSMTYVRRTGWACACRGERRPAQSACTLASEGSRRLRAVADIRKGHDLHELPAAYDERRMDQKPPTPPGEAASAELIKGCPSRRGYFDSSDAFGERTSARSNAVEARQWCDVQRQLHSESADHLALRQAAAECLRVAAWRALHIPTGHLSMPSSTGSAPSVS